MLSLGPKENTVCDFWRMVWEQRIETTVMLTQCVEAGKVRILPTILWESAPLYMCECVWDGMVELNYVYPVFNRTHVSSIGLRKWEESMTQTSSP